MSQHIAVLGAGSWGTALALALARNQQPVQLWGHHPQHIRDLQKHRCNQRYLPDIPFPEHLNATESLENTLSEAKALLIVVPSGAFRSTLRKLAPHISDDLGIAWATKGLEHGSGQLPHQVLRQELGEDRPCAVISGPSFAGEVARDLPTAVTVAGSHDDFIQQWVRFFHSGSMRLYHGRDMIGVEIGGAVKNVLAVAAGIADGLGFGANTRAALITRGLAEMMRLGKAVGGLPQTMMGLTGVGDLVLTCTDNQSRNRRFGVAVGQGATTEQACQAIGQVVEGIATTQEIKRLADQYRVEMPITEQIHRILDGRCTPRQAVEQLLARTPKHEHF